MRQLAAKECIPCSLGTPPLGKEKINEYFKELEDGWDITDNHHLERTFKFKNFKDALEFTNAVGELAEIEGHHPDIYLSWGIVKIIMFTHKINGLSEADFVFAAKIDELN